VATFNIIDLVIFVIGLILGIILGAVFFADDADAAARSAWASTSFAWKLLTVIVRLTV
jgi:hypothetical protein